MLYTMFDLKLRISSWWSWYLSYVGAFLFKIKMAFRIFKKSRRDKKLCIINLENKGTYRGDGNVIYLNRSRGDTGIYICGNWSKNTHESVYFTQWKVLLNNKKEEQLGPKLSQRQISTSKATVTHYAIIFPPAVISNLLTPP